MCPVALMRRGIAPPTSAMNSRRFIANPSPDAFNHNEFFITGPSHQTSEMGSFSTEFGYPPDVRFTPDSDRTADIAGGPVRANSGHPQTHIVCAMLGCSFTAHAKVE